MRLALRDELPFVTVTVGHGATKVEVPDVLVDAGSASTLLNADVAASLGTVPEPQDRLRTLCGVGGRAVVFVRRVDRLVVGGRAADGFEVEIGGLDYGFALNSTSLVLR
jgi:predicted aspartyl protease